MTPQQWLDIAATIQARWPNIDLPVSTLEQWGKDLEDLPADQVAATIEVIYREGDDFAPHAGKIRKRLVELMLDPPEWGEVLEQLRAIERAHPSKVVGVENEDDLDQELRPIIARPRDDVISRSHPMVVAFREHLATQIEAGVGEDGNSEARLREKWAGFQRVATQRMSYQGIEPASLPALERANRGRRQLREGGSVFAEVRDQIARPALPEGSKE